jgi:hypothetical protein
MILDTIIGSIVGIINKAIPDKDMKYKLLHEIEMYKLTSDFENAKSQLAVNAEEAKHNHLFVAGWRPFIGWCCGIAFVWHVLIVHIITFLAGIGGHTILLPEFDMMLLMNILFAMLGLGGYRTYEKIKLAGK